MGLSPRKRPHTAVHVVLLRKRSFLDTPIPPTNPRRWCTDCATLILGFLSESLLWHTLVHGDVFASLDVCRHHRHLGSNSAGKRGCLPVPSNPNQVLGDRLVVPYHPAEVHVAHKPRRETLVVTLEREGQLVHLFLEYLNARKAARSRQRQCRGGGCSLGVAYAKKRGSSHGGRAMLSMLTWLLPSPKSSLAVFRDGEKGSAIVTGHWLVCPPPA